MPGKILIALTCLLLATAAATVGTAGNSSAPPNERATMLVQLMAVETRFSDLSERQGLAEAFAANIAPRGVMVGNGMSGPDAARKVFTALPGLKLRWGAIYADISSAGDLGYTIGIYNSESPGADGKTQTGHGMYVTVWGRQSDGAWKFLLDGGAGGMSVEDAERLAGSFRDYPGPAPVPPARPTRHAQDEIRDLEREYLAAARRDGINEAMLAYMADDAVMFSRRERTKSALADSLARRPEPADLEWEQLFNEVAQSEDLACTFGVWQASGAANEKLQGTYVVIWKRQANGKWKFVVDGGALMSAEAVTVLRGRFK